MAVYRTFSVKAPPGRGRFGWIVDAAFPAIVGAVGLGLAVALAAGDPAPRAHGWSSADLTPGAAVVCVLP